ncbi:diguanylate cyclase [Marinobacterium rhizophilum]|uniref:diguanylate cyclase n=1 Tax=Marinobacterium rhizophilum TaxID=420402 RepID=A0ABY5HLV7_9GAMM|nr:diguanylate cyclase [Marinobacterium rhizophilum]UTW12242.1 diguanylate cyclase [Marinobacterium rhizophilum]
MTAKDRALETLKLQRQRYLERLPATVAYLGELAQSWGQGRLDEQRFEALKQGLHRIAGSAGIFGLEELGREAGRLEAAICNGQALEGEGRRALVQAVLSLAARWLSSTEHLTESVDTLDTPSQGVMPTVWLLTDAHASEQSLLGSLRQYGFDVKRLDGLAAAEGALVFSGSVHGVLVVDSERVKLTTTLSERLLQAGVPIVFISRQDDFESRLEAARLGGCAFFARPLDVMKLVELIDSRVGEREAEAYRILIVDDDELLSLHYQHALRGAGMQAEIEPDPADLISRLETFRPDLLLLDINMPGYSGIELATSLRFYEEWTGLPIVFLSAEVNQERQLLALGQGGDDFIAKPISEKRLVSVVRARAERMRRLAGLRACDGLTGLLNHVHIKEALAVECMRAMREQSTFSVVMLDIDHFKQVNDTYGHARGDSVIRALSHLLKTRLRGSDKVGRYGGEEFLAIMPGCQKDAAQRQCDWLREAFAALEFEHEGVIFSCTLSAGIASSEDYELQHANTLLECADQALYAAKDGGRNRVIGWHRQLEHEAGARHSVTG